MVQYNETFPPAPRYNELQNTTYMPQSISYMYGYMYIAALCVYVYLVCTCVSYVYGIEHIYIHLYVLYIECEVITLHYFIKNFFCIIF